LVKRVKNQNLNGNNNSYNHPNQGSNAQIKDPTKISKFNQNGVEQVKLSKPPKSSHNNSRNENANSTKKQNSGTYNQQNQNGVKRVKLSKTPKSLPNNSRNHHSQNKNPNSFKNQDSSSQNNANKRQNPGPGSTPNPSQCQEEFLGSGSCRAAFKRWYFNTATKTCTQFIYGGCDGNGNNFKTEEECANTCSSFMKKRVKIQNRGGNRMNQNQQNSANDNQNSGANTMGQSNLRHPNNSPRKGEKRQNSGQNDAGNANNQQNQNNAGKRQNQGQGSTPNPSQCQEEFLGSGSCRAAFKRWYFNTATNTCTQFIHGGCDENGNNFKSEEECANTCSSFMRKRVKVPVQKIARSTKNFRSIAIPTYNPVVDPVPNLMVNDLAVHSGQVAFVVGKPMNPKIKKRTRSRLDEPRRWKTRAGQNRAGKNNGTKKQGKKTREKNRGKNRGKKRGKNRGKNIARTQTNQMYYYPV